MKAGLVTLGWALLWGFGAAAAEPPAEATANRVRELNQQAVAAFEAYSYKKGEAALFEALELARRAGQQQLPVLAETYVLLGAGALSGSSDSYRAMHYLVSALRLDAKVGLPRQLVTPELKRAFEAAHKAVKAIGSPPKLVLAGRRAATKATAVVDETARGLDHTPIDEAKSGYPVPVKVAIGSELRVQHVYLYFRAAGKVQFTRVEMDRRGNVYRGAIPAGLTKGPYLHYYIEALDPRGRLAASNGSAGSPNVVTIK